MQSSGGSGPIAHHPYVPIWGWDFSRIHLGGMLDYLTPGYRNSGEGRPVWKRPLFIILTVLVVVGAAYFFSGDGTSGLVVPVIAVEISRRTSTRRSDGRVPGGDGSDYRQL